MKRLINALCKYGIIGLIVKFLKKVLYRVFRFFDRLDNKIYEFRKNLYKNLQKKDYIFLEKLCKNSKYKNVFVFYPYTEWNLPVFQRPQQIALSLSKKNDVLYIFCTANYNYDFVKGLYRKINNN